MRIGYARVSTQDQRPELQLDSLAGAACEQVFQEKQSGKDRDRPELETCLKVLRKGDTLVVWRLDRLGRSLKDLVEIVHALEDRGVGFQSLTESIDTTNAGGKLIFHVFAALAEFERNLIRERTVAGLAAARARGRKGGRKAKMSKADVRKAAAMLLDPLMTKTEVAKHFGISRVTLNLALEREGYPAVRPDVVTGAEVLIPNDEIMRQFSVISVTIAEQYEVCEILKDRRRFLRELVERVLL